MHPAFGVNPHVAAIDAPPIPTAQAWKAAYDGRQGPMIDLSQAVPGLPPPAEFLDRLAAAAGSADAARYGPILGDPDLREALAADTARTYRGAVGADNVAITSGCNQAFVVAMLALAQAGDSVILPAPWYFNHRMTLDMLGIATRILPCRIEDGFVPYPEAAERLIDASTRAIVLVSPNNPTGAVYPQDIIARFADLARRRGIALVLDETYRDFLPADQPRAHALFEDTHWGATLVQLYSFSKSHAIPGHRLGAIIAAPAFIAQVAKIQDSLQICPARPAQRVAAWAVDALRPWREA
ncbi:MAG TPA: aminotransferase, partial [Beijerinckiaceae bacterium]|nr:aminotransferase [Beijerinckiaceae bacterium]